jgi:S-adenosylmethionine:tRNA ribosyltransferase-isomerase
MHVSDFHYELPEELIAHYPVPNRSGSRLLCMDKSTGVLAHKHFSDLLDYLQAKDLLVFNDTRVLNARLLGAKGSGGRVEALIERVLGERDAIVQLRASKSPKPGTKLYFEANTQGCNDRLQAEVLGRDGAFFKLAFKCEQSLEQALTKFGHVPLPPYIKREDELTDKERYQTVYSKHLGAVAAPTAGLHFDQPLLDAIAAKGVASAFVTLHVGSGTFQPLRVDNPLEHEMHSERIEVTQSVCDAIAACKARGGRVIAVGTTSVRSLESAVKLSASGQIAPYTGETDIFIYPGYEFQVVDAMVTNFHLSESTLMMLVSAFAGREQILTAYRVAVEERYRFFSYGDAMLLY